MADNNENILLLTKCNAHDIMPILHRLTDGICRRGQPTYQDHSPTWTLQEWWDLVDSYQELVKTAVREAWTKDQILKSLDGLPDDYKTSVVDVINSRRSEVKQQLLSQTNAISHAVLTDFDWKLKLVMSSDKISSVQEPVLSLDLDIQQNEELKTVGIELDKDDLRKLITSLEGANKAVQQLKS